MDEQTHVTIPTVDVWVMPHDDERVRWVINDRDDMLGNYADMLGEGIDPGTFEEYLDTWTHLVMPVPVWQSDLLSRRFVERAMRGPK